MAEPQTQDGAIQEEQTSADPLAPIVFEGDTETRFLGLLRVLTSNKKALIGVTILAFFAFVAIFGPLLAPYDPTQVGVGLPGEAPSSQHWLGTTQMGEDIYSQLLAGTRGSLEMAVAAALLATFLAITIGLSAGYFGGMVDNVLSVLINVFLIFPTLPLLIVVSSYANAYNLRGPLTMAIVIATVGWPWGARALRSQMLSMRAKDFVLASRVAGESGGRIMFAEILPNMLSIVVANFIFSTLAAVAAEVGLDFIGLGDTSQATWGTMLYWAQSNAALLQHRWNWFIPPGICIGLFSIGLVLTNYAIDEMTNPRLRAERAHSGSGVVPYATTNTLPDEVNQGATGAA